jgi:hypothetical protein
MSIPGLPALPDGVNVFTDIALLAADVVTSLYGADIPQWGLYLDGVPAVIANSVIAFRYKVDWRISKAQLEQGAFASYNKVQVPFDVQLRFASNGSQEDRQALLDSVAAIIGSLELFDAVTPEVTYSNVNPTHYDYQRTATDGQGMLIVDVYCEFVNIGAEASFGDTQSPGASPQVNNGQQQPQVTRGPDLPNISPPPNFQ